MKTDRMRGMIFIFLLLFLAACAEVQPTTPTTNKESDAIRDLGKEYFVHGKYANALNELLKAEKLNPHDYLVQDYLGLTYQKMKRYNLALEHFKKAIALNPDYGPSVNNLGGLYLEMKDWDAAIACLTPMVEESRFDVYLTPQLPRLNLGLAFYEKGNYPQAEKYYRDALKYYISGLTKDLHYLKIAIGLGRTYRAAGKPAEAIPLLQEAVETAPTIPILYYEMGKAFRETGDDVKAIDAFDQVITMAPKSEIATAARKEIAAIGK